jgi:hypothetical protein
MPLEHPHRVPSGRRDGALLPNDATLAATGPHSLERMFRHLSPGRFSSGRPIRSQGLHPEPPCRHRFRSNQTHSDLSQEDRTQGSACRPTGGKPKQSQPAGLVRHQGKIPPANTSRHPFVLNSFKYYLTLFSKFFSSFPHGTCSLSVSHKYLALEEIYLPLRAALPSNPTLRGWLERGGHPAKDGILTLSDAMFQWT